MPVETTCPSCGQPIAAHTGEAGRRTTCPACGVAFTLPPFARSEDPAPAPLLTSPEPRARLIGCGPTLVVFLATFAMAALESSSSAPPPVPIVLYGTWLILLGLLAWAHRFTLRSVLLWTLFTALYLTLARATHGRDDAVVIWGATVLCGALLLWGLAAEQDGRAANRSRQAGCAMALVLPGMLVSLMLAYNLLPWAARLRSQRVRRVICCHNLRQIGRALAAYHDDYNCFPPPVTTDGRGRPMHSWTVYVLPYLDEDKLYAAYNFARPFNAPANTTVGSTDLHQFQCPESRAVGPLVHYGMVVCPGSLAAENRYPRLADVKDEPGQTLIVAEMSRTPLPWTQPGAIVDPTRGGNGPKLSPPGCSSDHTGGCQALTVDGQVRFISDRLTPAALNALSTAAGNEAIGDRDW